MLRAKAKHQVGRLGSIEFVSPHFAVKGTGRGAEFFPMDAISADTIDCARQMMAWAISTRRTSSPVSPKTTRSSLREE